MKRDGQGEPTVDLRPILGIASARGRTERVNQGQRISNFSPILGAPPPTPPINPLSLADPAVVDTGLRSAGSEVVGRHGETAPLEFSLGSIDDEDTVLTALIPVTPTLNELQQEKGVGDDVLGRAKDAMREAMFRQGRVNQDGMVVIRENIFRYFCAKKV